MQGTNSEYGFINRMSALKLFFFLCRPQMGSVDIKVSSGHVDVSKEKNLVAWVLGGCWVSGECL